MLPSEYTEQVFRDFERNVLDTYHQTLPLWKLDQSVAIYAALAQFDSFAILSLFSPASSWGVATAQKLKGLEEGLSQAIRWLHPGAPQFDLTPTADSATIELASEFCAFATKYVDIADMHKMYGREQVGISVDEKQRRVRFVRLPKTPPGAALIGMAEGVHRQSPSQIVQKVAAEDGLRKAIRDTLNAARFRYVNGRIELDDLMIANAPSIRKMLRCFFPDEALPLAGKVDLVGFTVDELATYFESLKRWSFCCTFIFLASLIERGKQQWECMPTQIIERQHFEDSMHALTGLAREKVNAITERLAYDGRTGSAGRPASPEVFQQPLFCGPKSVAWSSRVVLASKYHRNMLKLMTRTQALQAYSATLIGSREGAMLRELGGLLSTRGRSDYKLFSKLKVDTREAEIDLLAYNPKFPAELLLVEGKATLGADEINEVDHATVEMQKGQVQVQNAEEILRMLPDEERHQLFKFVRWQLVESFYRVVVSADVDPNPKLDQSVCPGISLQTIKARLRDHHYASPQKFWRACKDRKWLSELLHWETSYQPITVGDVTYELPITGSTVSGKEKETMKEGPLPKGLDPRTIGK